MDGFVVVNDLWDEIKIENSSDCLVKSMKNNETYIEGSCCYLKANKWTEFLKLGKESWEVKPPCLVI